MAGARSLAAALVVLALGAGAGYLARGEPAARVETRETARIVRVPVGGGATASGPSVDDLRAIVREELARREETPAPVEPAQPSHAAAVAEDLLDLAASRGEWTDEDRKRFRDLLSEVAPAERRHLISAFVQTINKGTRVATSGPPL